MRCSNFNNSKRLQKIARELAAQVYIYRRVGFDQRPMTFCADGAIGHGAADRELFWDLREVGEKIFLEICSNEGRTCRLRRTGDQSWEGRWEVCEKMAVSIEPKGQPGRRHRPARGARAQGGRALASLFIISLPRCLSSGIYHHACHALGLSQPTWTTDGEILNADRYCLLPGPNHDTSRKFIHHGAEPQWFRAVGELLNETVSPTGYGYKDVVQPFVTADWLKMTGFPALRIRRPIADVAYSMIARRWFYPARLFPSVRNRDLALVRGLMLADQALESVPAAQLEFDDYVHDESALEERLKAIYGTPAGTRHRIQDERFRDVRRAILERRKSRKYRGILDLVEEAQDLHQAVEPN